MSILDQVNETEWGTLIEVGKARGSLTLDEVLSVLGVELTVDVLTDVESAFRPEGIPPGAGSIVARKDGFAPSEAVSLELGEGQQKLDVVLTLRRG